MANENLIKIAESDMISGIVCNIFGTIIGGAVTGVIGNTLESILPKPATIGKVIVQSLGVWSLSTFAGYQVGEYMTNQMKENAGAMLAVKSIIKEASLLMENNELNTESSES